MSYAETPQREIRHFNVYKGEHLVLTVEDTPGPLFSVAGPPPGGAPHHPFASARAYDALMEEDLATQIWNAANFDDFLAQLIASSLNIASWNDSAVAPRTQRHRLFRGDKLVGALWLGAGQFTTLAHQPPYDALVFDHAMLTAYAAQEADTLLGILQKSSTFSGLGQLLREAGYTLLHIEPRA